MRTLQQHIALLCCLLMVDCPVFSAFNAATEWDIRTTGNDANGGGFQAGATGTDYSQQDAAQWAYTDIVVGGTTTQGTSLLRPFSAVDPGNVINITAGVGCTVQRVQVVSVAVGVATFDKSLGAAASVCTGNLGGSLLTPGTAAGLAVASNKIHVQTGTYIVTAGITLPNANPLKWIGYQTTHEDFGTKPLITTATDSVNLFTPFNGAATLDFVNIRMSNTASTRGYGIINVNTSVSLNALECQFDGFVTAVFGDTSFSELTIVRTEIENSTGVGIRQDGRATIEYSNIHDNVGIGVFHNTTAAAMDLEIIGSLVIDNGSDGISTGVGNGQRLRVDRSVIANNTGDGIDTINNSPWTIVVSNSIIYGNGDWGIAITSAVNFPVSWIMSNSGMGANTTGNYGVRTTATSVTPQYILGAVAISADPFTNAAAGDYSLNNTAGGGADLKATGFPGVFPGGTTTGYLDIGAAQSQAAAVGAHGSAWAN